MKKLLKKFLDGASIKSQNLTVDDAEEICTDTDFQAEDFIKFFESEKNRIIARDKKYEENRIKKTVVFSESEYEKILKKMKILDTNDFSNFAKFILLDKKIKIPNSQKKVIKISKFESNLNQIAHKINLAHINKSIDIEYVIFITKELMELKQDIRKVA